MKHQIQDYLNEGTLTPTDTLMGEYAHREWWSAVKDSFDDLLWLYYPDRTVFFKDRFPFNPNDPENAADIAACIASIQRSFSIFLKSKDYTYSKLYETTILEYNPLYNVDGTEIEDRVLRQGGNNEHKLSGTDTTAYTGEEANTLSGTDTTAYSGTEANTLSGTDTLAYSGSEAVAKTGYDSDVGSGTDTNTTSEATFDSAGAFLNKEKVEMGKGATDTHNYNSTDTTTFTDREDATTYGKTDTKSFEDREDSITYGKTDTKTFNEREDSVTYGRTDTETRNLHDDEHIERRRFGNIGVTKSTDLIDSQRNTVLFDFYKKVVHDCVNLVTYAVE